MKSHLSTFNYWHCASVVMPSALSSMTILTCVFFLMIYSSGLGIAPVRALVLHVQGSEFNQVLNSFCFFSPSVKCCWKWCGLKRLIQKDLQLELNLDYRARACLKLKKKKKTWKYCWFPFVCLVIFCCCSCWTSVVWLLCSESGYRILVIRQGLLFVSIAVLSLSIAGCKERNTH
jgi:hypothetical protein